MQNHLSLHRVYITVSCLQFTYEYVSKWSIKFNAFEYISWKIGCLLYLWLSRKNQNKIFSKINFILFFRSPHLESNYDIAPPVLSELLASLTNDDWALAWQDELLDALQIMHQLQNKQYFCHTENTHLKSFDCLLVLNPKKTILSSNIKSLKQNELNALKNLFFK